MELQPLSSLRTSAGLSDAAAIAPDETQRRNGRRFDDILGQTLAGPLFAIWTPAAPVNPVSAASSTGSSTVAALDPDARRGRRRQKR